MVEERPGSEAVVGDELLARIGVPSELGEANRVVGHLLSETIWPRIRAQEAGETASREVGIHDAGIGLADDDREVGPGDFALSVTLTGPASEGEVRRMLAPALGAETAARIPLRFEVRESAELGPAYADEYRRHIRPAPGGVSIGNKRKTKTQGTLGCFARGRSGERQNMTLGLSCWHVIAEVGRAKPQKGDVVLQPSYPAIEDLGGDPEAEKYRLETLESWADPKPFPAENTADAAVFQCLDPKAADWRIFDSQATWITYSKLVDQTVDVRPKLEVGKCGQTSGTTRGVVKRIALKRSIKREDDKGRVIYFDYVDVVEIGHKGDTTYPFALPGDSGSICWKEKMNGSFIPLGMMFAEKVVSKTESYEFMNLIKHVKDVLDVELLYGKNPNS
ncbi:hypothetical protein [Allonocardiopsis opalescens]|uniref:Uncharacterized protein n=1 Tax=Allonocardiopsis opalescens TaxID=1144618 RepID=A0A2T0Q7F8_9ACTN|nr:hypothetical protein [Allonocardiopsis opalescens]PRX99721.1 hypothetical protein CLV72_103326 [Allonocardiopsis opalescens]